MVRPLGIEYPGACYRVMNSEMLREQAAVVAGRTFPGRTLIG
jgi:hypothetical protein